jgi:hypothetical protein
MKSNFSRYPFAFFCLLTLLLGCSSNESAEKAYRPEAAMDSAAISQAPVTSSEAGGPVTPERKFIRTADVKFKAGNVTEATEKIEDLIRKYEGFVNHTNLIQFWNKPNIW